MISLSYELLDTSEATFLDLFAPPCDDSFVRGLAVEEDDFEPLWEPLEEDLEIPFE